MKSKILGLLAVGLLVGPMAAQASAVVVDFEDVAIPAGTAVGDFSGFSRTSNGFNVLSAVGVFAGLENGTEGAGNGTTHFFGSNVTMTYDGKAFDLRAFDLGVDYLGDNGISEPLAFEVRIDFEYWAGGSNWMTVGIGPDFDFPTFYAGAAGDGLRSVTFSTSVLGSDGAPAQFALDNLQVRVPEPGTLALLGLGLAAFGVSRRRKAA